MVRWKEVFIATRTTTGLASLLIKVGFQKVFFVNTSDILLMKSLLMKLGWKDIVAQTGMTNGMKSLCVVKGKLQRKSNRKYV